MENRQPTLDDDSLCCETTKQKNPVCIKAHFNTDIQDKDSPTKFNKRHWKFYHSKTALNYGKAQQKF